MIRMQAFYSQLQAADEERGNPFFRLLQISRARLKTILTLRSAPGWEDWPAEGR